jgi:hypothetical protein
MRSLVKKMTKKRARRSKKSVARKTDPEKALRKVLGGSKRGAMDRSTLEALPRATLLEACRVLELRGTSRLPKEEIVSKLLVALQGAESAKGTRSVESGPEIETTPAPTAEPAVVEHAARSRAEFQAHKFALTEEEVAPRGAPREPSLPRFIPWGYGQDRVRAVAVDPERLYVYWEVTDEARERAKAKLGPGGSTAWLNLRVYDTTGRLFDGTNAHSYFDHRVENGSRQWFFDIGKPGSDAFVEVGMKSREGYFVRIARSGRAVFPRRSPAPYREPQWLTVRALAESPMIPSRRAPGAPPVPAAPRSVRLAPVPAAEPVHPSPGTRPSTEPPRPPEESVVEVREEREIQTRWEAPATVRVWEEGPFSVTGHAPEPVAETYSFEASTFEVDGRTHVVFGPWQVVIRGLGAFEERRVLARWMVYRSFAAEGGSEAPLGAFGERMLGSSALLGASERRFRGASELLLKGASELLYRGASERRLGGASESIFRAASERLLRGASERRFLAASEKLFGGGSERRLGGASGRR